MAVSSGKHTKKYGYTAKEIMEKEFNELWNRSNSVVAGLVKVQDNVVEILPTCKKNLPKSFEELAGIEAQRNLTDYIRLRLLYELAEELWKFIDKQCRDLVYKHNERDIDGEIDAEVGLRYTLDTAESFPFKEIANDSVNGLLRFNERFIENVCVIIFTHWEFHDIIGTIANHGLQYEKLWQDALEDTIPTDPNIGALLPDDEIVY